ncbi:signal peptidase I [Halomarina ordinaria]|uniref:Signal peptidase I n=1 Tax=Halomarina ordinaria TaxID=3033939 RepID=A0ABD5U6Y8_9EURY|nr:signal peptidase I [Halomarina sp. PSRA2]
MNVRRTLGQSLTLVLIVVAALLLAGPALGQPLLLSYVETGSMEPTMEPGDGFVAVPTELTGPVEQGDVVTYEAEEIEGGGLTTHRVVGETDRGYTTQGDANPFTDQDDAEPPVQDAQIVAKALQVNGEVVVIPYLGTAVMGFQDLLVTMQTTLASLLGTRSLLGAQGLGYLVFALTAVYYVVDWYREGETKRRERTRERETGVSTRVVLVGFAAVLVVGATAAMVGPSGTQEFGVVSAEFDSERPDVIPAGESKTQPYAVPNAGLVPTDVYLEPASDGVRVADSELRVGGGETAETEVTLSAPPETGYYRQYVVEYRYLAVLPASVVGGLYAVHPWLPVVVIDALLAGGFLALTLPFVDGGRVRRRSRPTRGRSLVGRLLGSSRRRER